MDLTQVKHEIETLAEKHRDEFETVSACIFAHPELAYHETLAQDQLCGLLAVSYTHLTLPTKRIV